MQRREVERAARARGDKIGTVFSEKASASTLARPQLSLLRAAARARLLRRLYVYRLDRLARSGIRDTLEVVEELRQSGCEVVSVGDGFTLDGPASEIVLAVMAWAAKMERLAINERIAAARSRVEAEGGRWGRPSRLDEKKTSDARRLRREGRSVREIAIALKIPKSTIARAVLER